MLREMAGLEAFLGGPPPGMGGPPMGGPPPGMPGMGGPPGLDAFAAGPPMEEEPDMEIDSETDEYASIIEHISSIMGLPTVTEQERAQMMKAQQIFQSLLANNEKMQDQATGGSPMLRKALVSG